MTTVEFADTDGNPVGTVTVTAGQLQADPWLESVTDTWLAQGKSPAEFVKYYDGWSNGQVIARIQGEENTVADTPKLGSGARFKKLVAQVAAKGADDPKALAASIGRKKLGAKKFGRLAANAAKSQGSK